MSNNKKHNPPVVFISHTSSEAGFAKIIKELIEKTFVICEAFVSSEDIIGGDNWREKVFKKLKDSSLVIAICSENSIIKPWVAFEVGAAWGLNKKVIPLLHYGLEIENLPEPFNNFQGYTFREGLDKIIESIKEEIYKGKNKIPPPQYTEWIKRLEGEDESYTYKYTVQYVITGQNNIYKDAKTIIQKTKRLIRVTGFGEIEQNYSCEYNDYKEEIYKKLLEARNKQTPIELRQVFSEEKLPGKTSKKMEKVKEFIKSKTIKSPRMTNVLIVDNDYMHLSIPIIKVDKEILRHCIKTTDKKIIDEYITWFDEYLWKEDRDYEFNEKQ